MRKRRKNLLVVEGHHEKNILFRLMLRCFPEMDIDMESIWIYGTNIYRLEQDIIKEYGDDWDEEDIDLPFVISKRKQFDPIQYKNDFTNIILVFDYEHHAPEFDECVIEKFQRYFTDAADVGRLYINYPMIESYQHLHIPLPDGQYKDRLVSVKINPGKEYKKIVKDFDISKRVKFLTKIDDILKKKYEVQDEYLRFQCVNHLLSISTSDHLTEKIEQILKGCLAEDCIQTARHLLCDKILRMGYLENGYSYWSYMRKLFVQIILQNICKANKIQNGTYDISDGQYKTCFDKLDLCRILHKQNEVGRDRENGYIWILNTCVFIIPDYHFDLVLRNLE